MASLPETCTVLREVGEEMVSLGKTGYWMDVVPERNQPEPGQWPVGNVMVRIVFPQKVC